MIRPITSPPRFTFPVYKAATPALNIPAERSDRIIPPLDIRDYRQTTAGSQSVFERLEVTIPRTGYGLTLCIPRGYATTEGTAQAAGSLQVGRITVIGV
jgi:hypothetical protein